MNKTHFAPFVIAAFVFTFLQAPFLGYTQGCSDAGVCSMGNLDLKSQSEGAEKSPYLIKLSQSIGIGEQGVLHSVTTPELQVFFLDNWSLQLKAPISLNNGNLGTTAGLGDFSFSGNYVISLPHEQALSFTLGLRLPSNDANKLSGNRSLPMPYQTSLGTLDGVIGLAYKIQKWSAVIAYQDVLFNYNNNQFTHLLWSDNADAQSYFESNGFVRGNDAILRLERKLRAKKGTWAPSILAIYRIQEDQAKNAAAELKSIAGSSGLTLNANVTYTMKTKGKGQWDFLLAAPFVVRAVRPDGLTRAVVLSATYQFN